MTLKYCRMQESAHSMQVKLKEQVETTMQTTVQNKIKIIVSTKIEENDLALGF